jgi:hypothetical protein
MTLLIKLIKRFINKSESDQEIDLSQFTDDDKIERKRIYEALREHILKSQLSNSENFDKAILSLSSAFLGASLTFTNSIIPLKGAWYLWQLYLSWASFILGVCKINCVNGIC